MKTREISFTGMCSQPNSDKQPVTRHVPRLAAWIVSLTAAALFSVSAQGEDAYRTQGKTEWRAAHPRPLPKSSGVSQKKMAREKQYPKLVGQLESRLMNALEQVSKEGVQKSVASLSASGARVQGENVIIIVECDQTVAPKDIAALIVAKNGTVIRTGESHVKAAVPITALETIAGMPGVSFVRTPIPKRAMSAVQTEGLGAALAGPWHAAGFTGQGVKVAVIDVGFAGLATRKAQGEIPASAIEMDFSGTGMTSGTDSHGNACAEIIYDMAPNCQMYLIKSLDRSDDEAAKNYCKAQGIQIISFSGGYDAINFHDGTAPSSITPHPVAILNDADANGILWVNAAGNNQLQHAMAAWRDGNADKALDWDSDYNSGNEFWNSGKPLSVGKTISAFLTWNEWPVTDQDFDLILYRWTGSTWTIAAISDNFQCGTQPPFESITFTITTEGYYALQVEKYKATRSPTFILRVSPYDLYYFGYNNYDIPAPGSIIIPGDAAAAFTVGAIKHTRYTNGPIEYFSSLGPNNGAYTGKPTVVKPDICGADGVSTATYGATNFYGTSAACPHIAGLAALVKGRYPEYNNAQLKSYLQSKSIDLGSAGKDNTYGYGPCVLPAPSILNYAPTNILLSNMNVTENLPSGTKVGAFSAQDPDLNNAFVYTLVGGDVGSFTINGSNLQTAASFNYEVKSNYSLRVQATDQGGLSTQKVFSVNVSNVNEAPTNLVLSCADVAENLPSGTKVGAFSAQDPDVNNAFVYTLVGGDVGLFTINGSNLQTTASFNYEVKSNYSLRVRATDQGGLSTQKVFAVNVSNANETPTNLVLSCANLAENLAIGTKVGAFSAQDPDLNNAFVYTLVGGDVGSFTINGSNLQTAASFNYEVRSIYSLRVQATDQGGLFTQKVFVIKVSDVNEAPTNLVLSGVDVAENLPLGTKVGTFSAQDPDVNNAVVYTLVGGDVGSFTINGRYLRTAASFNYEVKSNYSLRVQATDQCGLFTQKVFVVNVSNVNEAPTNLVLSCADVAENLPSGTKVGTFSAQDPDVNNAFVYTLISGDIGSFTINGSNLQTAASFNYEVKSNYSLRVQATDQCGLFTKKVFAIRVTDANETPFFFCPTALIDGKIVLRWNSVTNHLYTLHSSSNLSKGFSVLQRNLTATPAINAYTVSVQNVSGKFWRVSTVP